MQDWRAVLQKFMEVVPDPPADEGPAHPAPCDFRAHDNQRDSRRNDNFRVAADPPDAFNGQVRASEDGGETGSVTAEFRTQALAGDLESLFL